MPGTKPSRRWRASFAALENVEFRWLLASNAAFFLALNGQLLTRSYLAWDMTHEEMSLAYINSAFAIPMLFLSLLGGVLTDRFERRKLILIGQTVLIVNELVIFLQLLNGSLTFTHLLIAGVIGGMFIPIIMPARSAVIFNTVGVKRLGNAIALGSGVLNSSRVVGPALMSWAISAYSPTVSYGIASALLLLAFICMLKVSPKPVDQSVTHFNIADVPMDTLPQISRHQPTGSFQSTQKKQSIRADLMEGIRYLLSNKPVLLCLIFGSLPMWLALPFQNLLILYADNVWQVGEKGLGIMMSVAGVGGMLGSIWVASRGENTNRMPVMIRNIVAFAAMLILFSITSNFYLALLPLLVANFCVSSTHTLNYTTIQLLTDDHQRGRVSSFVMLTFGLTPLGVIPLAWMAKHLGVATTINIASAVLIVAVFVLVALLPRFREIDDDVKRALDRHTKNSANTNETV